MENLTLSQFEKLNQSQYELIRGTDPHVSRNTPYKQAHSSMATD